MLVRRCVLAVVVTLGVSACKSESAPTPAKADPPRSPPSDVPASCATDADCVLDRCAACTCRVRGKSGPACEAAPCAADPCGRSAAVCKAGICALVPATR